MGSVLDIEKSVAKNRKTVRIWKPCSKGLANQTPVLLKVS